MSLPGGLGSVEETGVLGPRNPDLGRQLVDVLLEGIFGTLLVEQCLLGRLLLLQFHNLGCRLLELSLLLLRLAEGGSH